MSNKVKQTISEDYKRLKKAFDKIMKPKERQQETQWVLQPVPVQNKRF